MKSVSNAPSDRTVRLYFLMFPKAGFNVKTYIVDHTSHGAPARSRAPSHLHALVPCRVELGLVCRQESVIVLLRTIHDFRLEN
jgi:hypothetical protein